MCKRNLTADLPLSLLQIHSDVPRPSPAHIPMPWPQHLPLEFYKGGSFSESESHTLRNYEKATVDITAAQLLILQSESKVAPFVLTCAERGKESLHFAFVCVCVCARVRACAYLRSHKWLGCNYSPNPGESKQKHLDLNVALHTKLKQELSDLVRKSRRRCTGRGRGMI